MRAMHAGFVNSRGSNALAGFELLVVRDLFVEHVKM